MKNIFAIISVMLLLVSCKSTTAPEKGNWLTGDRSTTTGDQTNSVNVVYFDFDSSALSEEDKEKIATQADMWKASKNHPTLIVEGHCDKVGNGEYNLALGNRRAYAAKKELEKHGIPADKIETISYGKERPAVMDNDALNRRAITLAE